MISLRLLDSPGRHGDGFARASQTFRDFPEAWRSAGNRLDIKAEARADLIAPSVRVTRHVNFLRVSGKRPHTLQQSSTHSFNVAEIFIFIFVDSKEDLHLFETDLQRTKKSAKIGNYLMLFIRRNVPFSLWFE